MAAGVGIGRAEPLEALHAPDRFGERLDRAGAGW